MSLLTVERSSSSDSVNQLSENEEADDDVDEIDAEILREEVFTRSRTSSFEGFFASKGAAYAIPDGDFARKANLKGGELQCHLQGMVNLLRDEDAVRLPDANRRRSLRGFEIPVFASGYIVKLETQAEYTRYLSIVTSYGTGDQEESILLGFDWVNEDVTIGLVIPFWGHVAIELDGDGGFKVKTKSRDYIFKPVSVQTMWTALQWINRCIATAHQANHYPKGLSHSWLGYYENRISSPREFINYWESMDELRNKRDGCITYFDKVKTDEELLKQLIRHKLKEILTRFDLEEVTCRQVREALEAEVKMSLNHLKGFVDEQLFIVIGQMDSSSKITNTIYLGSEWNASNLQELKENGVGYILNITKEIDNFFPGTFEYMNIRLYDVEEADLLQHWGKTYKFLHEAKEKGCAALVHCRRGISRSASTVIAYLMKENNMCLHDAMKLVKSKRSIVEPNAGFWKQLIIYEGIVRASRQRHNSIFRKRINSDTGGLKRLNRKTSRQKKEKGLETDHKDGPSERAHTLPSCVTQVAASAPTGTATENVSGTLDTSPLVGEKTHTTDIGWEAFDAESDDEASDSDSEAPLTASKLRRTHSEPVMKTMEECSQCFVTERKQRSKTFAERDDFKSDDLSCGDLRLPTRNAEITEGKQDDFLSADTTETEETNSMFDDTPPNAETPPDAETPPVAETLPDSETPPVAETPPDSETPPDAETPPVAETLPDSETPPVAETPPDSETPPDAETPPVAETLPDSETPPVAETPPDSETPPDAETPPVAETLPEAETLPFLGTTEKQVDDASEEQHPGLTCREDEILTGEINRTANVSSDSAGEGNEKGPIADEVQTSATEPDDCATEPEGCPTEPDGCPTVGDGVELVRDDPQEVDSGEKSSGGPEISENVPSSEGDTPLSEGHRLRTRSIGDKLEAKLFLKQGKLENSENLKKVEGRGRVRRRERKSKSDLQLPNSGFVKRHTQIIEEQMLYSMLMNSEKTLASSVMGIAGSDAQATEDGAPDNSGKDSALSSGKDYEKNDENVEEKAKNEENDGVERSDEDNEAAKNDENDKEKNSAIQSIVQEVNAEAKRDIQGQVDASWLPLPSQGDSTFDTQGSDNVCIDEMAWIELTSYHGDVVKRKSAVFENASEERNRAMPGHSCRGRQHDAETGEKLSRSPAQPREGLETESCFAPEVNEERLEIPKDDGNAEVEHAQSSNARERCIDGLDQEILKLDLGEPEEEEEFSETPRSSNSIVVEDYREWESSSVRDRTKILENIIAKAGGSFPSPRSRAIKKEIQSPDVDDNSRHGVNRLLSTTSEIVESRQEVFLLAEDEPKGRTRSSSCPINNSLSLNDGVISGEEMVRFLVDKFESKKGDIVVNRKCHAI